MNKYRIEPRDYTALVRKHIVANLNPIIANLEQPAAEWILKKYLPALHELQAKIKAAKKQCFKYDEQCVPNLISILQAIAEGKEELWKQVNFQNLSALPNCPRQAIQTLLKHAEPIKNTENMQGKRSSEMYANRFHIMINYYCSDAPILKQTLLRFHQETVGYEPIEADQEYLYEQGLITTPPKSNLLLNDSTGSPQKSESDQVANKLSDLYDDLKNITPDDFKQRAAKAFDYASDNYLYCNNEMGYERKRNVGETFVAGLKIFGTFGIYCFNRKAKYDARLKAATQTVNKNPDETPEQHLLTLLGDDKDGGKGLESFKYFLASHFAQVTASTDKEAELLVDLVRNALENKLNNNQSTSTQLLLI